MDTPRKEHPRPDFERKAWQNLNGKWQFAIDTAKCGLEKGWQTGTDFPREIIVPFCPESKLSGVAETDFLGSVWYRRKFTIDKPLRGQRLLLHFGAVDYDAKVWVNGAEVVRHRGGYTPFSADITHVVTDGENEVVVYAVDDERSYRQPLGKQADRLNSYGCSYTRTTGIWQTVWIEAVPNSYISGLTIWPNAANGSVNIEIDVKNACPGLSIEVIALDNGKPVASENTASLAAKNTFNLVIPNPVLWEVGKPFLYDLALRITKSGKVIDEVTSYFGLRDVRIDGVKILINGKSVFQRLILDQGFWPDGIYTAPSDDELRADIERSMAMGFNGARLHQKVFEPRTLYWADKLGYIVWGEFPDWGCEISKHPESQQNFYREWIEVVMRDRSHPSIVAWTPFNETQQKYVRFDAQLFVDIYNITKSMDPTRPVVDSSGYTHVKTDIWDVHDYEQDPVKFAETYAPFGKNPIDENAKGWHPEPRPTYLGQPMIISEYGGTWWNPEQSGEKAWGYGDRPKTEEEFIERYTALADVLMRNPNMAGLCYTQLTDVEQEVNGLYTYDRKPKFPPEILKKALDKKAAIEE
ncbi:MAG: beta-galactosidase [Armatimonadetes bacterium]|nr:beta-galactosidase [Armatimonadota bacterium]